MAIKKILHYPDDRLRADNKKVTDFGPSFQRLIEDMAETMYAEPGIGLAAPQIGVNLDLFIIDIGAGEDDEGQLLVFANPEILDQKGEVLFEEGCLSFPNVREQIKRSEWVHVKAQDAEGEWFEIKTDGLLAIAIQHENDHIEGILMIDRLSPIKRKMALKDMQKREAVTSR